MGTNGNIASYSSTAGAAADRFVVDYGTSTTPYSGTSYSAPRVAGYAAIIKQKYPNATGEQIAAAILNTAVLKPGWDPVIYGKGQVDLTAALSSAGGLK
ncbi:S8 family serine peptidase [Polynucleobacter sp. IMCC 29146]|uniref:S8 family serine peptidase n=1 Tax=Polynucleobacter sp. IMCC 29146 TaxID=2780953 RepID=UPI00351D23E5